MNSKKINFYITNLNIVNIIIGYTFFVSLLMPFTSNQVGASQVITIPYRAFSLIISLLVIIINIRSNNKLTISAFMFFLFWIAVLLRMFYDMEIRSDYYVLFEHKIKIWLIAVAGCFIPMISIFKSIHTINLDYCMKLLFSACIIILIPSFLFSIENLNQGMRETGNAALDPISFAMSGVILSILSLYKLLKKPNSKLGIIINSILCLLGLFLALKTGSRGPILAFIIIILVWYSIKKNKGILFLSLFAIPIYLFWNIISISILFIAPLFGNRIIQGLSGEDMSILARQESYSWFINQIIDYPLFGSQFARLGNGTYPGYSHSLILDLLLGFGIFGLLIFLYCFYKSFNNFKFFLKKDKSFWIGLIMLQYLLLSLTSGAFYSDPQLNCLIMICLLLPLKQK